MPWRLRVVWLAVFFGLIALLTVVSRLLDDRASIGPALGAGAGDTIRESRGRTEGAGHIAVGTPGPGHAARRDPAVERVSAEISRRLGAKRAVRLGLDGQ